MSRPSTRSSDSRPASSDETESLYAADSVHAPEKTMLEEPPSGYLWCRECERVFRYGQFRSNGEHQLCPFDDCSGKISGALTWEVRQTHHPAFPKYPVEGNRYKRGC